MGPPVRGPNRDKRRHSAEPSSAGSESRALALRLQVLWSLAGSGLFTSPKESQIVTTA